MGKPGDVGMGVGRIEDEDKMRGVDVGIEEGILVLVLVVVVEGQRVVGLPCLCSWRCWCIQLILSTQWFWGSTLSHRLHGRRTSVIASLKQSMHGEERLFVAILRLATYLIESRLCFSLSTCTL